MKLVSFCVYGKDQMYTRGIVFNAQLMKEIYPGWIMRVYCEPGFPRKRLEHLGVQVIVKTLARGHTPMLWRFLPAWERDVERVIFRDADSRINVREAVAVKAWEESGLNAHAMHDHPHHRSYPLFGGMWGIRGGMLPSTVLREMQKRMKRKLKRVDDMKFLRDKIHPLIRQSLLRHSSVKLVPPGAIPFPAHLEWEGFVGEKIE